MHVVGTSLWCDAARASGVCFVSSAEARLGRGRAERLVMTEQARALRRGLGLRDEEPLLPRYGRPFALGRARLELLPSGGSPGGAQLLVELGAWRGLYAGQLCAREIGGISPMQVRACDELVLDAPIAGGVVDGREGLLRAAGRDGLVEIEATELAALAAARDVLGPDRVLPSPRLARAARGWFTPPRKRAGSAPVARLRIHLGARPADEAGSLGLGLLPSAAELARLALESGSRQVWVRVDGSTARLAGARALVAALGSIGLRAAPIGPPEQLSLFA